LRATYAVISLVFSCVRCIAQKPVLEATTGFQLPVSDPGGGFLFTEDSRDAKGKPVYACWAYHPGWDMNPAAGDADLGTPVLAAANGLVVVADRAPSTIWGRLVIQHL
jgi:murein DD-endopeptidase MepM/ murein hydrolase activator NlpD